MKLPKKLSIKLVRETDARRRSITGPRTRGKWLANIPEIPGVMAYGATKAKATASALRIAARTIELEDAANEYLDE